MSFPGLIICYFFRKISNLVANDVVGVVDEGEGLFKFAAFQSQSEESAVGRGNLEAYFNFRKNLFF